MLHDLNAKAEGKIFELEMLIAEKDENLKSIAIELERTEKTVRLLNNGTSKLDHLSPSVSHSVIIVVLGIKVSLLVQRLFLLNLV